MIVSAALRRVSDGRRLLPQGSVHSAGCPHFANPIPLAFRRRRRLWRNRRLPPNARFPAHLAHSFSRSVGRCPPGAGVPIQQRTTPSMQGHGSARTLKLVGAVSPLPMGPPQGSRRSLKAGAMRTATVGKGVGGGPSPPTPVGPGDRRVGVWRGGFRLSMSVAAPFVWRCLSGSTIAPFPHPPHRTGRAGHGQEQLGLSQAAQLPGRHRIRHLMFEARLWSGALRLARARPLQGLRLVLSRRFTTLPSLPGLSRPDSRLPSSR